MLTCSAIVCLVHFEVLGETRAYPSTVDLVVFRMQARHGDTTSGNFTLLHYSEHVLALHLHRTYSGQCQSSHQTTLKLFLRSVAPILLQLWLSFIFRAAQDRSGKGKDFDVRRIFSKLALS